MVQQRGRGSGSGYPPSNNAPRQNEYFVPRDGIDREVITADICRYLGNDALVRPGTHTNDNGRVIQGYFITAYRNLTTAMIADLKADSARWDAERRKSQSGAGTPAYSQRDRVDDRVHNPNSQAVRYQDSLIRDIPQRHDGGSGGNMNIPAGGGNGAPYGSMQAPYGGNGAGGYDSGARYLGSESPGYNTTGTGGPSPAPYGPPGGHGNYNNAPYAQGSLPPQAQYSAQPPAAQDPRFGGPPPHTGGMGAGYGAPINSAVHTPQHAQDGYASGAHYAVVSNRDMYSSDMQMTDAPVATARRSTPPGGPGAFGNTGNNSNRGAYGAAPPPHSGSYGSYSGPPPQANHAAAYAPPIDGGYGRVDKQLALGTPGNNGL
ncbi:hypothetical protein SBRCBS47491_005322 [Sporothrix bragantina]|uniref:Transcription factor n=1 Tax=Sporothrix bragantina TaxID=671064 RepID=A0ABP0BXU1_9PEZI